MNSQICEFERRMLVANIEMLKEAIKHSSHSITSLSLAIGMNESTFYRKLGRNGANFTVGQANAIKRELALSAEAAQQIFFADDTRTA